METRDASRKTHITRRVERVIQPSVRDIDQMLRDRLPFGEVFWIDELDVLSAELLRPRVFLWVRVDGDDACGADDPGGVEDAETDAAAAEDGHARAG